MKLCKRVIEYAGISDPSSSMEIRIEILGLRNAIKQAEELISRHEQALEIAAFVGQTLEDQQNDVTEGADRKNSEPSKKDQVCPPLVR